MAGDYGQLHYRSIYLVPGHSPRAQAVEIARGLSNLGFSLVATRGTRDFLVEQGLSCDAVAKVNEGRPDIAELIHNGKIQLVLNTPLGKQSHFDEEAIRHISERTCNGGAEILSLRKTTSAYNAPASAIATMVDSISRNRRRVLPCVCVLEGEYGQQDITAGVPAVLGSRGIEKILELPLDEAELAGFTASVDSIRADLKSL